MKNKETTHLEETIRLKRIEGQIRGVQKMIEKKRYCVDILTQLSSIAGSVRRVEENILKRHFKSCVRESFAGGSKEERANKIEELIGILSKYRK